MKYLIIRDVKGTGKIKGFSEVLKTMDALDDTEKKMKKLQNKYTEDLRICAIPEFKAGLLLYKNGFEVGIVQVETNTLWLIKRLDGNNDMILDPILKGNEDKFFINNNWDCGIENYNLNYVNNVHKDVI